MGKTAIVIFMFVLFQFLTGCMSTIDTDGTTDTKQQEDHDFSEQDTSISSVINEIEETLSEMDAVFSSLQRDIDSTEWLIDFVNYAAGKDLYIVETLHRNLKYQDWSHEGKRSFAESLLNGNDGILTDTRREYFREIQYLVEHSYLLTDFPWFVRSQFDRISEFSYWYMVYNIKSIDSDWVDTQILPGMLSLIPMDEITPVTYLWLKTPDSLAEMDEEILSAGYPWTMLYHLKRINSELFKILEPLYQDEKNPYKNREGLFI